MPIRYKHSVTKKIVEYDSVMGLFYVEGNQPEDCYKDTGFPIPISPLTIRNDSNWEYYEPPQETKKK